MSDKLGCCVAVMLNGAALKVGNYRASDHCVGAIAYGSSKLRKIEESDAILFWCASICHELTRFHI